MFSHRWWPVLMVVNSSSQFYDRNGASQYLKNLLINHSAFSPPSEFALVWDHFIWASHFFSPFSGTFFPQDLQSTAKSPLELGFQACMIERQPQWDRTNWGSGDMMNKSCFDKRICLSAKYHYNLAWLEKGFFPESKSLRARRAFSDHYYWNSHQRSVK